MSRSASCAGDLPGVPPGMRHRPAARQAPCDGCGSFERPVHGRDGRPAAARRSRVDRDMAAATPASPRGSTRRRVQWWRRSEHAGSSPRSQACSKWRRHCASTLRAHPVARKETPAFLKPTPSCSAQARSKRLSAAPSSRTMPSAPRCRGMPRFVHACPSPSPPSQPRASSLAAWTGSAGMPSSPSARRSPASRQPRSHPRSSRRIRRRIPSMQSRSRAAVRASRRRPASTRSIRRRGPGGRRGCTSRESAQLL